jgi:hypothetical protein
VFPREEAKIKGKIVMQTSSLSERKEAAVPEQVLSDDELENRVRSLLRWKMRFDAVHVAVESGHVTLSGDVISVLGPRNCCANHSQTEGRGRRHKLHHCQPDRTGVVLMVDKTIINRSHGSQRNASRRAVGALPVQRLKA